MPADDDPGDAILVFQREANEQLVLSGLRVMEQKDKALENLQQTEKVADALRIREEALLLTAAFRERLIGIIGHDLRSPLGAILMSANQILARGALTERDARAAETILRSGRRMVKMSEQLVEFTRVRLGDGFVLRRSACDLGLICAQAIEEQALRGVTTLLQSAEGDLNGRWDPDLLTELLSNIIGNAVDQATAGTPVRVHCVGDGAIIRAEIFNQGKAIPKEQLPFIFNAFHRADEKAGRRAGHLGLGLYIASEIATAHAGTIEARSGDEGTTFVVRLPRLAPTLPSDASD